MRSILFFLFFLFLVSCHDDTPNEAGQKVIESLFERANNDSIPLDKRIYFSKRSEKLTLLMPNNDSIKRKYLFKVANRYYNNGLYKDYQRVSGKALDLAMAARDSAGIGKACTFIRDYFIHESSPDSAYYFNNKAQKIFYGLRDADDIGETVLTQAFFQYQQSDYIRCDKTTIEALKYLRKTQNEDLIYEAYNLLGLVYNQLGDHKLSKNYFDKALSIARRPYFSKELHLPSSTLNNLGLLYQSTGNHHKAIEIFKTALKSENIKRDRPSVYATLLDNESYSKMQIGETNKLKEKFLAALRIRDSIGDAPAIIINKIHLSEFLLQRGENDLAKKFALEAERLAKEKHQTREMLGVLRQLSKAYPEKALQYSEKYYKIDDSLEIAERKIQNKFARIEFETEELIIEKDKLVEQRKSLIYITLGIITLGVFIFVIRFQAAKNRELRLIQEQQQANEEVYQLMLNQQDRIEEVRQAEKKRIAQELHDGVLGRLFGTRMNLGVLNTKSDEKAIAERIAYIDELKSVEQEIREISHDLSAEKAAIFNNFVLMVSNFIATQRTVCQAAIDINIDDTIDWNSVNSTAKINLYRILQEAFQNVNKHANARNVKVRFFKSNDDLRLEVRDDGVGFNYAKKKKGIGLINMLNRITNSRGTMEIETAPGAGTLLKFVLPLSDT